MRLLGKGLLGAAIAFLSMGTLIMASTVRPFSAKPTHAQAAASLADLASLVPADASDASIELFYLDSAPYATVQFDSPSSSPTAFYRIYGWGGSQWFQAYDVEQLAHDDCQTGTSLSGNSPGNPCDLGRLHITDIHMTKLMKLPGDTSQIPNMLAFAIRYEGDLALQGGGPLVFLRPSNRNFVTAATLAFGREGVGSVFLSSCSGQCGVAYSDYILVHGPAYLPSDLGCCPTGRQYIVLNWTGTDLTVSARCTKVSPPPGFLTSDVCNS
jgi:hypothetical protein